MSGIQIVKKRLGAEWFGFQWHLTTGINVWYLARKSLKTRRFGFKWSTFLMAFVPKSRQNVQYLTIQSLDAIVHISNVSGF